MNRFTGVKMTDIAMPGGDGREITLRFRATCCVCRVSLPARSRAIWDRVSKTATCIPCSVPAQAEPPAIERVETVAAVNFGVAGASAQRSFDAKESRRKERLRRNWWVLAIMAVACGAFSGVAAHKLHTSVALWTVVGATLPVLDLIRRPQHIDAWRSGAAGERAVGKMLDGLRGQGVVAIHDRRVPGRKTNIDHIAVARTGVFVIDTKNVASKVAPSRSGLRVAGRWQDKMLDGVAGQVAVVQSTVDQNLTVPVTVRGVLCFTKADLPWIRPQPRGIALFYPRGLRRALTKGGDVLTGDQVNSVATLLATKLPPA